ncbi:MAG TPA: glycoside hydrolase family 2 TIM barrel-domain containing protein [Abditibacterium sp.]|jgi:beta-mannosidase
MQLIPLPTNWQARAISNPEEVPAELQNRLIPAVVPGCIHLDLLRENLIPDPYLDQNEALVQWIGRTDWEYSTTFSVSAEALQEERVDLVCEGLDTVATVFVNGIEVGRSENMHVEARFDVKAALLKVGHGRSEGAHEIKKQATDGEKSPTDDRSIATDEKSIATDEKVSPRDEKASPRTEKEVNETKKQADERIEENQHEITIRFDSAALYARAMRAQMGDLPNVYPDFEPYNFIRKNACNFGWDWGPTLITCGIWKAIRLEAWSVARIKSVKPLVKVANEKVAVVDVEIEFEFEAENKIKGFTAFLNRPGETEAETLGPIVSCATTNHSKQTISFTVRNPQLWWPRGYGDQVLYDLLIGLNGVNDDQFECKIGLREVELDFSPDDMGAGWTLKVNGREIWCKGANWIPDDVFATRASDPQRLETRLQQAADCGMNMMRIWGGGLYESDAFYSICDRMGLMVWQDFLFACAAYPEEEPMRGLVEAEVRHNVTRLSKHPSLVLWNGGNENIWGYFDWGWKAKIGDKTWGLGYYLDILPALVKEIDPTRPYWPGSPYSGTLDIHPNADAWGLKHMWETWNRVNHTMFRSYTPRFASEFGHQAPPTYSTIVRSIPEDARNPYSPAMLAHQKADGGNDKLHSRVEEHFELPTDFDDWLYITQLMQARAMTVAVEWFRSRPYCKGALYWQLNDCWPVTSWAAIDGDGKPKPLYYASKQFFRDRLLTIQPDGEHLALWAHNDSDEEWIGSVAAEFYQLDEFFEQGEQWFSLHVPPRSVVKVGHVITKHQDLKNVFLHANGSHSSAFWFFDIDKNLNYPEPKWTATTEGNTLKIEAHTLLRDLVINADRFGGTLTENVVTLLPDEVWEVEIEGADLSQVDFSGRPMVNCANYFGKRGE